MRVVFMGTPVLAADILREVAREHEVVGVFTRPDAVRGRGKKLAASPVKELAEDLGIPVVTANAFKGESMFDALADMEPEVICVAACGMILPPKVLELPRYGCLNVHTSLLPRWRGAAPIERSILAGDEKTGVCIMRMDRGLDTGPYCLCKEILIGNKDVAELTDALAQEGSALLLQAIDQLETGITWTEQDEEGLTYADKIRKGELDVTPEDLAVQVERNVRASSSAHPCKTTVEGRRVTLERVVLSEQAAEVAKSRGLEPGQGAFASKKLVMMAADGPFEVLKLKPDGKKSLDAVSFASGIQGIKAKTLNWGSDD